MRRVMPFDCPPTGAAGAFALARPASWVARASLGPLRALTVLLSATLLAGCAGLGGSQRPDPGEDLRAAQSRILQTATPQALRSAPADGGQAAAPAASWWARFDEPVLLELIEAARSASPNLSAARSRIAQARAAAVAADSALEPQLGVGLQASYGPAFPRGTARATGRVGVQASWEIDVFGGQGAARDAAIARLEAARLGWQSAQLAVAAETAQLYLNLRVCEAQVRISDTDVRSREETSRVTELTARAGFLAPASAALARGSAAQGRQALAAQRTQCRQLEHALAALTDTPLPALQARLATARPQVPQAPDADPLAAWPAALLARRPDVQAAEWALLAAAAEIDHADAQRLPKVSLGGLLGHVRVDTGMALLQGPYWTIGPLQVSFPVFETAAIRAASQAARTAYEDATTQYRAALLASVRDVQDARELLTSAQQREQDARVAVEGFEQSLAAVEARFRGGLASVFELEDARRSTLLARAALLQVQRDQTGARIALFRALGGPWPLARSEAGATPNADAALAEVPTP